MNVDEWVRLFQTTESELEAIIIDVRAYKTNETSTKSRLAAPRRVAAAEASVVRLSASLSTMQLHPTDYRIGQGELERRRRLLANMRAFLENIKSLVDGKGARSGLLDSSYAQDDDNLEMGNLGLLMHQQQQIEDQDEKLDMIGEGINKLKNIGCDINSELDLQAALLSALDDDVERTDRRMMSNVRGVDSLSKDTSSSLCPIGTMFLLLGVIVILLSTDILCLFC